MTPREFFAGQALGWLVGVYDSLESARRAVEYADALVAALRSDTLRCPSSPPVDRPVSLEVAPEAVRRPLVAEPHRDAIPPPPPSFESDSELYARLRRYR